jgi:hypothetical protein
MCSSSTDSRKGARGSGRSNHTPLPNITPLAIVRSSNHSSFAVINSKATQNTILLNGRAQNDHCRTTDPRLFSNAAIHSQHLKNHTYITRDIIRQDKHKIHRYQHSGRFNIQKLKCCFEHYYYLEVFGVGFSYKRARPLSVERIQKFILRTCNIICQITTPTEEDCAIPHLINLTLQGQQIPPILRAQPH